MASQSRGSANSLTDTHSREVAPLTIYLDCNATAPIEPEVADIVMFYMREEYGNAGSRTHEFGLRAKRAVEVARKQIAHVVDAEPSEVIFTSGATESNNIAILGLVAAVEGKRHIISSPMEHKAVLEPLEQLTQRGFEVELLPADEKGWIDPQALAAALRPDTVLVSLMHVNNETGVKQPLLEYADVLEGHDAYFHTDSAQGFGKEFAPLQSKRIDLISISGHKIYGPKGVGALVTRRRGFDRIPLAPLMFGGGQEWGIRPGTLAVPLVAGLGLAAHIAERDEDSRVAWNLQCFDLAARALTSMGGVWNGDPNSLLGLSVNVSLPGVDSEAVILAMKGVAAVSNGSACTSQDYRPSHVLTSMGISAEQIDGAVRISWSHLTPAVDWAAIKESAAVLLSTNAMPQREK
jgi:cysteine desulfurase